MNAKPVAVGQAAAVALLFCAMLFAGCSSPKTSASVVTSTLPPIDANKGAITGVVIDDRYRPVPDALVLLTPIGLTATSDAEGQFQFTNVDPGAYILQANAKDHEAAPKNVDVHVGQYAEVEVEARRTFSSGGFTITTAYSVFSPCMQSAVFYAADDNYCMPDSSGDTFRPGITVDFRSQKANLTYLVSEIKINQADNYVFVVRCAGGGSFGCGEFGYANTTGGDYGKVIMMNPGNYMHTAHSVNWTNKVVLDGLLFYYGTGGSEITPVARPVGCTLPPEPDPLSGKPWFCRDYYGAGAKFGVKAKIVMTAFLGAPDPSVDIATYNVLGSK
ncbi:MAG: carboxypeptidase-like regulatory domain-containing protein [bacterium]